MSEISAGAITYTMKDHVPFYLLIKDFHGNYGFAKGFEQLISIKKEALQ